ncbi:hypothetical protein SLE2022_116700 [Rubroshorea leprosula]
MGLFSGHFAALLLSVMLVVIEAEVHHYDFVLKEKNFTRLCSTKSTLVVNESIPGPVIRVHKGDTVYVNVHNQGNYGLTIHWHGVRQPRNPWSDGTSHITQCMIEPRTNLTYEVIFSDEEGTLWWHAHSNWTRQSVHGAIVVYPPRGTTFPFPEPDGEEILVLGDWFEVDVNYVIHEELKVGGFSTHEPNCSTFNSQPGDFHDCSKETTYRWLVDYGKTYLLRLVDVHMDELTFFAIAGHNLTVVGTDGAYIKPIVTSYIMMAPGQTMDILVTTNQSLGEYYMATRNCYSTTTVHPGYYTQINATAILQYRGNYSSSSPSFPSSTLPYYTNYKAGIDFMSKFRSLASEEYPVDVPKNISTRMFVTVALNENVEDLYLYMAASLNNVSWLDPTLSVLDAYYWNISGFYTTDFPDEPPTYYNFLEKYLGLNVTQSFMATKVKLLDYNEEVEIVFQSTNVLNSSQNHPMHLHGHSFYVVGLGEGNFNPNEDPKGYNLIDPPYQNTAIVPKLGWFALRFRASNPGVWFMHCHIEHHYTYGMNTVFLVKNGGTVETSMRERPSNMPSCRSSSIHGIQKSKNSAKTLDKLTMI